MRVEDAIGCIFRGNQLAVAGDNKQLPPTRFFDILTTEDDWNEDLEDESDVYESILDALSTIPDQVLNKMLRWHYRSRHEELIAFSNKEFYDNHLFTFPSPAEAGAEKAIEFIYVPDGIYERGGKRRNLIEARRVVELIFENLRAHPQWSLAIVTFNEAQKEAIQDELDRQLEQFPELKVFLDDNGKNGKEEPFRIKNLELIQGDERDVIIFSVGYGRDEVGKPPSLNFGPLNKAGGRRRLNVAVTRARQHVFVVSSMQPEELAHSENEGVRLLREYMYLARDGLKALFKGSSFGDAGKTESPFEEAVYSRLVTEGLELHRQVGCSGYRIDLAAVDPKQPDRYCLGIECDGAMYHSARTARDRDRLRQQVLENLGWRIHRIWSRDWNTNPDRETQRVLELVHLYAGEPQKEALLGTLPSTTIPSSPLVQAPVKSSTVDPPPAPVWIPDGKDVSYYEPYRGRLRSEMKLTGLIAEDIASIVDFQGPTHRDALVWPFAERWGYQRPSKRVRDAVALGVDLAGLRQLVRLSSDRCIIYPKQAQPIKVRVPHPGSNPRSLGELCPEEIAAAIQFCLKEAGGSASEEDILRLVANLYGHQRAATRLTQPVQSILDKMLENQQLILADGIVRTRSQT